MRCYICPDHPEKVYTSWRKFRGHWSTRHRGEECPPREDFLQEMEKEAVLGKKKEYKEGLKEEAEVREEAAEEIAPGEFILPEDPVPRLAKILEVHGVPVELTTQVLGVFQLHPAYRENPVNLHYLLTAKLPRRLHSSIPMMISAFTTQEGPYPEGSPFGMMQGGMGPGVMPPFMTGGGYPPYYPPTFGYQPFYRPPISGREPAEEEGRRPRVKESNPVQDAVALLGTLMELRNQLSPEQGEKGPNVQEIFEGFRTTVEELSKDSKEQQDKLLGQIEKAQEGNKAALESIKEQLHTTEKNRLQDKISSLEEAKDEQKTEGLGSLLREAGEGLGTQVEGLRLSVTQGVEKLGTIAEKVVSVEGLPGSTLKRGSPGAKSERTVGEASKLLEAEAAVEEIARRLERS